MEWSLPTAQAESAPSYAEIVENVRNEIPEGLDQLYRVFRTLAVSLRRQIGFQDFEDRMHDIFLVVVEAIRDGRLREAEALTSYIHGVARLSTYSSIGVQVRHRRMSSSLRYWVKKKSEMGTPEDEIEHRQRVQLMREMLASLSDKERNVLTRFYLREQSKEQICKEMELTETQFRLTKSRAKQRLERIGPATAQRVRRQEAAA